MWLPQLDRPAAADPSVSKLQAPAFGSRWPNPRFGEVMRLEHWDNAQEQGEHAARRLLAGDLATEATHAYAPVPWFSSDQYDRKVQVAGRFNDFSERRSSVPRSLT